jgi:Zn-dependent metalloprotease
MKASVKLCLLLAAGVGPSAFSQVAEVCTNDVRGTIRFNNTNPAVLHLLDTPGNEGVSNTLIYASSVPPGRYSSSPWTPMVTRTGGDYAVTVSVDCNDSNGIPYQLTPLANVGKGRQYYYFDSKTSAPVVANISGPAVDFEECLGVVQLNFVDEVGHPVNVNNGSLRANRVSDGANKVILYSMPVGATQHRVYVEGGAANWFYIYLYLGSDAYTDRRVHYVATNITAACDEILKVNIVIPSVANLGRIVGTVDMFGEFEWSLDYFNPLLYPGYTAVVAQYGPFQNDRWGQVPGDNLILPSSGAFDLVNLVPSTLDPASRGYYVHAQMLFRTNRAAQYFRTPGLGWGSNAPVVVAPGQTVNLSNIFEIHPGYVRGKILLKGPPEIPGHPSLLRGIVHSGDNDIDGDGIPDGAGTYGVYWNYLGYEGVDRRATGARYTAAYGYGYGDFDGALDETNNTFHGRYELALGGLQGEASIWRPWYLNLLFSGGNVWTNDYDYFYNTYTIYDRRDRQTEVVPGQAATNDFAFCFSEVRVSFSSPDTTFYSPQIGSYYPSFTGVDFQGQPADYSIQSIIAYGTPVYLHQATNRGQVTLYLPQGTYRLLPSVVPGDGSGGSIGLEPIDITVGCGERIELEPCLQMNIAIPACYRSNQLSLAGSVLTRCSNEVTLIEYELNNGPSMTVCVECGPNPDFDFTIPLAAGDNALKVTAYDDRGGVTSVGGVLRPDAVPPTIRCPVDSLFEEATRPCGAIPVFSITALDNCDPSPIVVCTPPSGSLFPRGTTTVTCVATDVAGNSAQCSFPMFVGGGPEFPLPGLSGVSPQVIGIAGGAQMVIRGANFTIDDEVLLNGVALRYPVLVSAQEIRGQAPALPPGTHELQIRRCGEIVARLTNACSSGSLPRIFTFDPRQAFARGSNFVTIRGTNFLPTTQIRIGFAAPGGTENLLINPIVSADGSTIIGLVPPLPDSEALGPRDVIATDERGTDVLPAGICYLPNPLETDPQAVSFRALQAASTRPVEVFWRDGFPTVLTVRAPVSGVTPEERARAFVRGYRDLLRLQNPDVELSVRRVHDEGLVHVWLAQSYQGVPIYGAEIVVPMDGQIVWGVNGNLLSPAALGNAGLNTTPVITPAQAVDLARTDQSLQQPIAELEPATQLMIYDQSLFSDGPREPRLVWKVTMLFAAHHVLVDALTGQIVVRLPVAETHGGVFDGFDLDIQDAEREANAQSHACFKNSTDTDVADEDDFNTDYNNDPDGFLANRYARDCWAWFHGMDWHSFDNDNSQMEIFIHTTMPRGNVARWVPGCDLMEFADGAVDYDVLVHEFTHGIIRATSGLVYQFQSGALNEHYADTMGVLADRERGEIDPEIPGNGAPINWNMGENLRMPDITTQWLRQFDNPTAAPGNQPDYFPNAVGLGAATPTQANDFGGVHTNSGIANRAAFLMIVGGTVRGFPVTGIGLEKVKFLKFWAMRSAPANATFVNALKAETDAAQWFIDRQLRGFNVGDVCTILNAWAAVGIGWGDSNCDGIPDTGHDVDGDGIPNKIDNCPLNWNPDQRDSETPTKDGVGDVCDNCVNAFNPGQENADGDRQGDVCDDDIDNDGCLNTVDQDPNSELHRIGISLNPLCPDKTSILYGYAGINPAPFVAGSVPYCQDLDDDNDGIPDWGADGIRGTADDDPCPIGVLPNSISGQCAVFGGDCPQTPKNWYEVCLGGGCVEFFAKFEYAINPDPVTTTYVDHIRIVNETLYLQPNTGTSLSSLAGKIAQVGPRLAFRAQAAGQTPNLVRVEIWARATATEPAHLVAVVGEYDPAEVALGQLDSGRMLALNFEANGVPPTLGATWHVGADPTLATQDTDQDGLVDGWEILHGLNPRNPDDALLDSDGDGVSNSAEFRAGTNPSDATSVLRILRIRRLAGEVRVEFVGTPGRRFQLERSLGLSNSNWTPVGAELRGRGGVVSLSDSDPNARQQAFYRVRSVVK